MKRMILSFSAVDFLFASCKKCYECTCVDTSTAFGCTVEGRKFEMCETGLVGKTIFNLRVLEMESEGYVCTVK
jgi:hypothetical protein